MEPSSVPEPAKDGTASPAPGRPHPLSRDELLELGILAVEEPGLSEVKAVPVVAPPADPVPAAPIQAVPAEKVTVPEVAGPGMTDPPAAPEAAERSPDDTTAQGQGMDKNGNAAPVPQQAVENTRPASVPAAQTARMEMSANTRDLKGLSRLEALNTYMNVLLVVLVIGVLVGGWLIYRQLAGGGAPDLF